MTFLLIFIVIVEVTHYHEALFVGTLCFAYVLHIFWGQDKPQKQIKYSLKFFKPFLFGTIGAAINFDEMEFSLIPLAILVIMSALFVR